MERYGWTYDELQATPEDIVNDAIELTRAQAKRSEIEQRQAQALAKIRR